MKQDADIEITEKQFKTTYKLHNSTFFGSCYKSAANTLTENFEKIKDTSIPACKVISTLVA